MTKLKPDVRKPVQINVLAHTGDLAGCGTIRVIIPTLYVNQLQVLGLNATQFFQHAFTKDIGYYSETTYVIFQRSATQKHMELMQFFAQRIKPLTRTKIIYEIDDYLVDIPKWNMAYNYYAANKVYMLQMMDMADGLTVSTTRLKHLYRDFNANCSVIPNHLPKFMWGQFNHKVRECYGDKTGSKFRILYPCSSNHFVTPHQRRVGIRGGDLDETMLEYIRKTTDKYDWVFVGGFPLEIHDLIREKKIEFHQWVNLYRYPTYLNELNCDMGIAPLEDNVFNSCKSNIKMLEYSALGIPGVYSDVEPYKKAKMKSKGSEQFIENIELLAAHPNLRQKVVEHDKNVIKDDLYWEDNNNVVRYLNSNLNLIDLHLEVTQ